MTPPAHAPDPEIVEIMRMEGGETWQLRFIDLQGKRRQLSAHTADRGTALVIASRVELLLHYRRTDQPLQPDLAAWFSNAHPRLLAKLSEWQIHEPGPASSTSTSATAQPPPSKSDVD